MTTDSAPAPLTPADSDLSDFDRMSIDIKRLRGSKFDAMLDAEAWRAGLNLWISAWHARPAASLDDDEETLAVAAGLRDIPKWRKLRDKALRGFVKCADGRLYHLTLSEIALEAWIEKLMQRLKSGAGNEARWGAKFDAEQIDADIDDACAHLAKLNPDSKALAKVKRKRDKPTPRGSGNGGKSDPPGNPTGNVKTSHRDQENVPQGVPQGSQENRTDRNKGRSSTTPPSAQTSARATDPPTDAPLPASCGAV